MDVSREPLFRAEDVGVSGFFLDVFLLIFDLPPDRLGLLENVAGGGVVTMKLRSGSEPVCEAAGLGRTVKKLARKSWQGE